MTPNNLNNEILDKITQLINDLNVDTLVAVGSFISKLETYYISTLTSDVPHSEIIEFIYNHKVSTGDQNSFSIQDHILEFVYLVGYEITVTTGSYAKTRDFLKEYEILTKQFKLSTIYTDDLKYMLREDATEDDIFKLLVRYIAHNIKHFKKQLISASVKG